MLDENDIAPVFTRSLYTARVPEEMMVNFYKETITCMHVYYVLGRKGDQSISSRC